MVNEGSHNAAEKPRGVVNVTTNMNCTISLDGQEAGLTEDAAFSFQDVPFGRHVLEGATHRHFTSKEIFLSLPILNVKLVLEERGGKLAIESEMEECQVGLEENSYECPATIDNLKRGVYPITVSGDAFRFTDKVRIQNNQTTIYRITQQLVKEKETEAALRHYQHALQMPEVTLRDRKRKISALDEFLLNENRFDLAEGIETHRRLVQAIRQEEFAKETMTKAIQVEKLRKKKKYGLIFSIIAVVLIVAVVISVILTRSSRNQHDEQAYRKALQSSALIDYQDYLKGFGKSANHYSDARSFVDRAERDEQQFNQAKVSNTITSFQNYLAEFGQKAYHRTEAERELKKLTVKRDFPATMKKMDMVVVPGGSYFMGASPAEKGNSDNNQPPVWVKINPFAICQHEVTFDDFDAFCRETGTTLPNDARFGRGKRPVINVSWSMAMNYCRWMSEKTGLAVRLPSEAEWEFSCRASRMSIFFWGNQMDSRYCVSGRKRRGRTRPVESTLPNDLHLFDMSGNVYEWCSDRYQDPFSPGKNEKYRGSSYRFFQKYEKNESKNPVFKAWGDRRVLRGGSYRSSDFSCSSSHRSGALPETKRNNVGFRIAITIPQ